jgi:hypothetical protein
MTKRAGRPLRFLALTLAAWTGFRIAMLWPRSGPPPRLAPLDALVDAVAQPAQASEWGESPLVSAPAARRDERQTTKPPSRPPTIEPDRAPIAAPPTAMLSLPDRLLTVPAAPQTQPKLATPIPSSDSPPTARTPGRWSGDAWLLVRGDSHAGSAFGAPQLGGSQAGLRIAYALAPAGRAALAGRLAAPLHGRGREAALGIEWRPTALPVRLIAEMRVPLDGGASAGPAIGAVGGFGPVPVASGVTAEAYGQAGVIDRGRPAAFVDGAARLAHPLATIGRVELDAGGGLWGGAQRGAARLDLGPTVGVAIPIGRVATRLTLDGRARVAGDARPGSGLTLTLGADF